ncbi:MAG: 4Fe-4S dicluster domain-containing protein [Candidatus Omnitrophota bacterium]
MTKIKIKAIEKNNVKNLLKEAAKERSVYAPLRQVEDDVWFKPLPKDNKELETALENLALDGADIVISPKDIFFPQLETMFEFEGGKITEAVEALPKLLFGIRPCDLKGLLFADDFFKRDFEDKYYLSRMQDRFVIAVGCVKPPRPQACFCTSAKTGPFAGNGYDLQFIDNGDSYFVEAGSGQGEEFLEKYSQFFTGCPENSLEAADQIKKKAVDSIELKVDFQKALDLMAKEDFIPRENYERIGERCLYCGACLYTCPTCTCFNVFDNAKDEKGERVRNWDGCVFQGYTREASGHNPRKEKWLRTSRRYEHKLKYDKSVTGASGCTGCGRCLSSCPVNIGMSKFIQEITEQKRII